MKRVVTGRHPNHATLHRQRGRALIAGVGARLTAVAIGLLIIGLTLPGAAMAARVQGTLVNGQGVLEGGRRFHFENHLTGDIYIAPIHVNGAFGASLPPGLYDLRAQHGVIILRGIRVGSKPVELGKIQEHYPNPIARVLQWETLFPTLLTSPAPSTAYLYTVDTTVLPPETIASKPPEAVQPIPMPTMANELPNRPVAPRMGRMAPMGRQPMISAPTTGAAPSMNPGGQPAAPSQ
ncbi:MAG: hypothetical protein ACREQE_09135 [Candidatus Binataceae bacterium]